MKVVEKFVSINGEGTKAGELAVFIRFKGCNLNCSYCDTKWANVPECSYTEETPEDILQYILSTGVSNITLTGGEPLLQPEMASLLRLLLQQAQLQVEIETNGSVLLKKFSDIDVCDGQSRRPTFTMDYKLPSSGCESGMKLENFEALTEQDTVKFVSGSIEDLDRARSLIETYALTQKCHVYISPVFGSIESAKIVQYMIDHEMNKVRLQIQMHKVIWDPEQRGV